MLNEVDVVLVVGSQNSSNSARLAAISVEHGVRSHLVDGPDDIDRTWFDADDVVGVAGGASAPEELVTACVDLLKDQFAASMKSG